MKKILIILLFFVPLFANGQLYTANAMRVKHGDELGKWENCNFKIYIDEKLNIKIYFSNDITELRSVNDDYLLKEDGENYRLTWSCVDKDGDKCISIINSDKVTYIYLGIHYPDKRWAIFYNLEPLK